LQAFLVLKDATPHRSLLFFLPKFFQLAPHSWSVFFPWKKRFPLPPHPKTFAPIFSNEHAFFHRDGVFLSTLREDPRVPSAVFSPPGGDVLSRAHGFIVMLPYFFPQKGARPPFLVLLAGDFKSLRWGPLGMPDSQTRPPERLRLHVPPFQGKDLSRHRFVVPLFPFSVMRWAPPLTVKAPSPPRYHHFSPRCRR